MLVTYTVHISTAKSSQQHNAIMVDILTLVIADGVEDCISLDAILAYVTSNQKEGSDYIPGERTELFTHGH